MSAARPRKNGGGFLSTIPGTKLKIPQTRDPVVHRPGPVGHLEGGRGSVLTLLSAPAGYGKTTLVLDWLRSRPQATAAVAWMSLDAGDNDAVQFARLLVAALRSAIGKDGRGLSAATRFPASSLQNVCAAVINYLLRSPREIVLVLDDYHVIHEPRVHTLVECLLKNLPPCLRVIVLTREDPPLRLAQLRAQRALCELRMADLRFSAAEVVMFFRDVMRRPVSEADAAILESHTEGWIAALQLAALSMREGGPATLIAALERPDKMILDYLAEEILAGQPETIRTFLAHTAVLNRLSGPLCAAVLGGQWKSGEADALLERLERANLFLESLDVGRRWYRYHQLFADLLRVRLLREDPHVTRELHRRASRWYDAHGFPREAIGHALAAPEWTYAARRIEKHGLQLFHLGQLQTVLAWFDALPEDVVAARPLLNVVRAYALYGTNQAEAAERSLQVAEAHLREQPAGREAKRLEGTSTLLRALMAGGASDLPSSVALAGRASTLLPASDPSHALALVWEARGFRASGDVTAATDRAVAAAVDRARRVGGPVVRRIGLSLLAEMYMLQGRLSRAARVFREGDAEMGLDVALAAPAYCFSRAALLREQNNLHGAEHWATQGIEALSESTVVHPHTAAAGHIVLAYVRQAMGDRDGAIAALDALVTLARRREFDASVYTREAAVRAHLWLMRDDVAAAARWAESSGLSPTDQVAFAQHTEYLVLARLLIARGDPAAVPLLDGMLRAAAAQGRRGTAIELLALRALANFAAGDSAGALADLERALGIGEPEGYIRVFVDEGAPMAALLRRFYAGRAVSGYATKLLGLVAAETRQPGGLDSPASRDVIAAPGLGAPVADALSVRERDVCSLVAQGASNQEIATQLFVTVGTVKKHIHHIFGKLRVKSRAHLVALANVPRVEGLRQM